MSLKKKQKKKKAKPQLYKHDTSRTLGKPDLVFKTFMFCLKEGDSEAAVEVLAASLRHLNKSKLQRHYQIPRRTTYNLLQKKSIPKLDLVAKVCHAIDVESTTVTQK